MTRLLNQLRWWVWFRWLPRPTGEQLQPYHPITPDTDQYLSPCSDEKPPFWPAIRLNE